MKKNKFHSAFSILLTLTLAIISLFNPTAIRAAAQSDERNDTMIEAKDFLTSYGNLLRTADGKTVSLRGTNFGGWLVYEEWMGAVSGAPAGLDLIETLEKRFGKEKAAELIKEYQDNYITDEDFDTVKNLGFNCIRLPFWYKTLETDTEGKYDFSRLDYAVSECSKRGIYVILDCHGLPGFQSIAHHVGKINDCHLYEETPEGEKYREDSVKLWKAVAEHYKDEPAVAGYDLMNEPMCDFNENQDDAAMWKVYDMLYKAVREIDSRHIVIMEAIWNFDHLPDPAKAGWKNVMYELHLYDPTDEAYSKIVLYAKSKMFCVPVLVGEFHPSTSDAHWDYILNLFNKNNFSWTTWTYKGHSKWGDSDWFIYCKNSSEECVDINSDDFETIKAKWGAPLRTDTFHVTCDTDTFSAFAKAETNDSFLIKVSAFMQKILFEIKLFFNGTK